MSRVAIPTQLRINDPYQQRILQFDTTDSRVYLSRVSNYLLKAFGNDAVVKGFDIESIVKVGDEVQITIAPGLLIQDSTLIESTESITLSLNISGLDSCDGYLVLYTSYLYLESIEANQFRIKLSYITKDGLVMSPVNDPWDHNRNRVYLNLYRFDNNFTLLEVTSPDFFYINGKKYYKRGKLNFLPLEDSTSTVVPFMFHLPHKLGSYDIFVQLYDENNANKYINTLQLIDTDYLDISIEEYKPFEDFYNLLFADPRDVDVFTINKSSLDSNYRYTLVHDYDQKHVQVQVYNDSYELVHPRFVQLVDDNSLLIDFSNLKEDLAATYKVLLINNITIAEIQSEDFINELIQVDHNLNKFYINVQLVNNTTGIIFDNSAIILNDYNSVLVDTTICNLAEDSYTLIFYKNTKTMFNLYNDNTFEIPYNVLTTTFSGEDLDENFSITLEHNLPVKYPIFQFYDSESNIVIPDNIHIDDETHVTISFEVDPNLTTPLTVVMYGYFNSSIYLIEETSPGLYQLDLTESLHVAPLFQVYNSDDYIIQPDEIINQDNVYIFSFGEESLGTITVAVGYGFDNFSGTFSLTEAPSGDQAVQIPHDLETMYPLVQLYGDNEVFYPENIRVINQNTIELLLDLAATYDEYKINIITGIVRQPLIYITDTSYIQEFNKNDLILNILTIDHNLNSKYIIVQVYNNDNILVNPAIKINSNNQIEVNLTGIEVLDYFKIIILKVS